MHGDAPPGTWQDPDGSLTIEYTPEVLDEIRREAVDAFFSLPHGGTEIGGILIGARSDHLVRIVGYQPLLCEHARGPSFLLSEKDHACLAKLLEPLAPWLRAGPGGAGRLPSAAAVLQGLKADRRPDQPEAVGWYHSHTRSEIFLTQPDLQICDHYFPEPGHVALVVRPHALQPTRAGFFFRGASGRFQSERSPREFVLAAAAGRPRRPEQKRPAPPRIPPEPQPRIAEARPAPPEPRAAAAVPVPAVEALPPPPDPEPPRAQPPRLPPPSTEAAPLPSFLAEPAPRRSFRWYWAAAVAGLALLAGAGFLASHFQDLAAPAVSPAPLLSAVDHNGQLQIHWDRAAAPVRLARSATLEIVDGASRSVVLLDTDRLRSGSFHYVRQTERIEVRLVLDQPGGNKVQEYTSFLGRLPAAGDSQRAREDLTREAERLRTDLKNQAARTQQLERTIEDLRQQLRQRGAARGENEP